MDSDIATNQFEEIVDPRTGKLIKSAFGTDFFRNKFNGKKQPRPNAIHLMFLGEEYGRKREHVHAYLEEIGVDFKCCVDINKIGQQSYILEFINIEWRRFAITNTLRSFGKKYKVYPLVPDTINVHVGSIPPYMSDKIVLQYLRCFGTFSDDPNDITVEEDEFKISTGTRIYTSTDIVTHIPSYTWINGEQLTINYRHQPFTCRLCDRRGHKAKDCQFAEIDRYGRKRRVWYQGSATSNSALPMEVVTTVNASANQEVNFGTATATSVPVCKNGESIIASYASTASVSAGNGRPVTSVITPKSNQRKPPLDRASRFYASVIKSATPTEPPTKSFDVEAQIEASQEGNVFPVLENPANLNPPSKKLMRVLKIPKVLRKRAKAVRNRVGVEMGKAASDAVETHHNKLLVAKWDEVQKLLAEEQTGVVNAKQLENALIELQTLLPKENYDGGSSSSDGSDEDDVEIKNGEIEIVSKVSDGRLSNQSGSSTEQLQLVLENDLNMLNNCQKRAAGMIDIGRLSNPEFRNMLAAHLKAMDERSNEGRTSVKRLLNRTSSDEHLQPEKHSKQNSDGDVSDKDDDSEIGDNEQMSTKGSDNADSTSNPTSSSSG